MKFFRIYILLFIVSSFFTTSIYSEQFPNRPKKSFVVDQAGVISDSDKQTIDQMTKQVFKDEQIPIVVVTIPSLLKYRSEHLSIEKYSQKLFDTWGIGSKNRNYGVLLLISIGDRKARIELGKGWNHRYDDDAEYVMGSLIIPPFKRGEISLGILEGVKGLDAMVRGLALPKPKVPWWYYLLFIGLVVLVISTIISLFKNGKKGWGWALIAFIGVALFFMLRASARGGGGFGGGFSGGGGASGSW